MEQIPIRTASVRLLQAFVLPRFAWKTFHIGLAHRVISF
jgi:hypothetical protein